MSSPAKRTATSRSWTRPFSGRIFSYLHERIANTENPRDFGKRLQHELAGLGRYRVGDYRILCAIEEEKLTVLVVEIGHRSTIYDQ